MESHVVVSFRWDAERATAESRLGNLARLAKQGEALGATLCAYAPGQLAIAFPETEHEEAVHYAVRSLRKAEASLSLRAGIGVGRLAPLIDSGVFVSLSWGEGLDVASRLSGLAAAGEILVDGALQGIAEGSLSAPPRGDDVEVGGKARVVLVLDQIAPFVRDSVSLYEDTHTEGVAGEDTDPLRHPTGSFQIAEIAREALVRGDPRSLDLALQQLRWSGEHKDLAARLAGVLAMTQGAKEEGLRILRRAAEAEQNDDRRARAALAYAVGLAAAGRSGDALLEALRALAITRARADQSGEIACMRFLAQLAFATGHPEAAEAWERVGGRVTAPPPP